MKTNLKMRGTNISSSEVTSIGSHGFWLLVDSHEYFIPFSDYPIFKNATVKQILNLRRLGPDQYHWPDLDADVELEALETPERYPLPWRPKESSSRS